MSSFREFLMRYMSLVLVAAACFACMTFTACDDFLTKDVEMGTKDSDTSDSDGSSDAGDSGEAPDDDDGDNLSNDVEELFDMKPRVSDSDNDGFSDGLEFVGDEGDPLTASYTPTPFNRSRILLPGEVKTNQSDKDRDGLPDDFETENSLDPSSPDTDEDGYGDGLELVARSDPFVSDDRPERDAPPAPDGTIHPDNPPLDQDEDGLSDSVEGLNGTREASRDSDTDGFSDGIEYLMGSDGVDASSIPNFSVPLPPEGDAADADADSSTDGSSDGSD